MNTPIHRALYFFLCLVPALCTCPSPLHADELSELYLGSSNNDSSSEIGPNVLFVLDTSGSMTSHPGFIFDPGIYWSEPYDPSKTYPGACSPNRVYRKSWGSQMRIDANGYPYEVNSDGSFKDDAFQSCNNAFHFPVEALVCKRVLVNGWHIDEFAEWRPSGPSLGGKSMNARWNQLDSALAPYATHPNATYADNRIYRECDDDIGVHGAADGDGSIYISNGATTAAYRSIPNSDDLSGYNRHVVATGNFLNWFRAAQSRFAVAKAAFRDAMQILPDSAYGAVMRFDTKVTAIGETSSQGGMVIKEFVKVGEGSNRQDLIDTVWNLPEADTGGTPLGETMLEAALVYKGGRVQFGATSNVFAEDTNNDGVINESDQYRTQASVGASRTGPYNAYYKNPIQWECQASSVIYVSDGVPDGDKNAWQLFKDTSLFPNYAEYAASDCDGDDWAGNWEDRKVSCMPNVAAYLANEDMNDDLAGPQTVTVNTVGFSSDLDADAQRFLRYVAEQGKGTFTPATSYEELRDAFQVNIRDVVATNQSLSSPAVTVNAFNKLQHDNHVYFAVFDPELDSVGWTGNLKKYKIKQVEQGGVKKYRIVDATGKAALATNSSAIVHDALSFWTDTSDPDVIENGGADGSVTRLGGAAGKLTTAHLYDVREHYHYPNQTPSHLYTWFGDENRKELTDPENMFHHSNLGGKITSEMVGLVSDPHGYETINVIAYMMGYDFTSYESRKHMGAAPHGVPTIVTYGEDEATAEQIIYAPTNDGFLHAIDAATGEERWTFIPTEAMGHFADLYQTPSSPYIGYGLDGSIIQYSEGSGASDRKWLFFGMRRGGTSIYALDVTNKNAPKILWRIQGGDLDGEGDADEDFHYLAQTWSDPQIIRIRRGTAGVKTALVFGGGYDAATQDSDAATAGYVDDNAGNAVYIVDAETGDLLWSAGPGSTADLRVDAMKSSIAAPLAVRDRNDDGVHDLMFAVDLGGRVFRFDIDNYNSTANALSITGGVIATLGAGDNSAGKTENRKFFNKPDVVPVTRGDAPYWAVNAGSGDRERPKSNIETENYLFSIKSVPFMQAQTDFSTPVGIDDLFDATENPAQSLAGHGGWKVKLPHGGEKALAKATTFDYQVYFTTFDPVPLNTGDCSGEPGRARLYSMDLLTAGATWDINNDGVIDADDRVQELSHGTIPPPVTVMFLEDEETGDVKSILRTGRSDDEIKAKDGTVVRRTSWSIENDREEEQ